MRIVRVIWGLIEEHSDENPRRQTTKPGVNGRSHRSCGYINTLTFRSSCNMVPRLFIFSGAETAQLGTLLPEYVPHR